MTSFSIDSKKGASLLELGLMDDAALLLCDTFDALEGDIRRLSAQLEVPVRGFCNF